MRSSPDPPTFDNYKKKYEEAFVKPWNIANIKKYAPTFDGSQPTPKALPDGGSMMVTPPKKKPSNYKKSPDYKRLKDGYKKGELNRDEFKDGKMKLKKRSRGMTPRQ